MNFLKTSDFSRTELEEIIESALKFKSGDSSLNLAAILFMVIAAIVTGGRCRTQGDSLDELQENAKEALDLFLAFSQSHLFCPPKELEFEAGIKDSNLTNYGAQLYQSRFPR